MKMNRIFAALCAIVALGVSCQKEMTVKNDAEEIIVPEGMKYVSFEVGASTKITGNPAKWASSSEDIAVLAINNGSSVVYKFATEPHLNAEGKGEIYPTTKISGLVDEGAELKFVLYPYNKNDSIDLTADPSGNTFSLHKFSSFSYSQANSVASTTPFACKIEYKDGVYSAASDLKPLYSFLKVVLPTRATDKASNGSAAKPTTYANKIIIKGTGVAGATTIDFSGDEPRVELSEAAQSSTINVTPKVDNNSKLPADGYCLVPIVPGTFSDLKITAQYVATSSGVQYADYTAEYSSSNTFTRGAFKSVEVSGPFVTSATTGTATIDGSTLSMKGSAEFYTGGKVTASNYQFGFNYREKGTEDWTFVDAVYADNKFNAIAAVVSGKTYEVKAVAVAKNALSDGEDTVDQVVDGSVVENKAFAEPIVITIDQFPSTEYNSVDGGNWKYVGSRSPYTFPTSKYTGDGSGDEYDYYEKSTDSTPLLSGIVINDNKSGYCFKKNDVKDPCLMLYAGYIQIPGKSGYKITGVTVKLSGGGSGRTVKVGTLSESTYSQVTKPLGSVTYSFTDKTLQELNTIFSGAGDGDGIRLFPGTAIYFGAMEITYEAI